MGESVRAAELGFEEAVTDDIPVSGADGVVEQAVQGQGGVSTTKTYGKEYAFLDKREEGAQV